MKGNKKLLKLVLVSSSIMMLVGCGKVKEVEDAPVTSDELLSVINKEENQTETKQEVKNGETKKTDESAQLKVVADRVAYSFEEIIKDGYGVLYLNDKRITYTNSVIGKETKETYISTKSFAVSLNNDEVITNMDMKNSTQIKGTRNGEKVDATTTEEVVIKNDEVMFVSNDSEGVSEKEIRYVDNNDKTELFDRYIRSLVENINKSLDIGIFSSYTDRKVDSIERAERGYSLKMTLNSSEGKLIKVKLNIDEELRLLDVEFNKLGVPEEDNTYTIKVEGYDI